MHVLVVPDKFKGSLTASQAAEAIRAGLHQHHPDWTVTSRPIADGGEGTADLLTTATSGTFRTITVADPLGRPVTAGYGLSADEKTAFIDLAEASGLHRLTLAERNPLHTGTFGTGELIRDALRVGISELILCIGGSATNDAGIGLAAALGYQFLDVTGQPLPPIGSSLSRIARIDVSGKMTALSQVRIRVACDVTNPLFGPTGAAYVYAAQKGADETAQLELDMGLRHLSTVVETQLGRSLAQAPGSGAAGGVGFGAQVFLNAQLEPGFALVARYSKLNAAFEQADLIITGEGKLDEQTLHGKAIRGVADIARTYGKPVVAFCGKLDLTLEQINQAGLQQVIAISPPTMPLADAQRQAVDLLTQAVANTYPATRR